MKALQTEVQVELREGRLVRLIWNGHSYPVVALLDHWRFGGRWWLGEVPRECFLIQAGSLTAEVHHETQPPERWWLTRLQD